MKVKELIEQLSKLPQDLDVYHNTGECLKSVDKASIAISEGELKEIIGEEFVYVDSQSRPRVKPFYTSPQRLNKTANPLQLTT